MCAPGVDSLIPLRPDVGSPTSQCGVLSLGEGFDGRSLPSNRTALGASALGPSCSGPPAAATSAPERQTTLRVSPPMPPALRLIERQEHGRVILLEERRDGSPLLNEASLEVGAREHVVRPLAAKEPGEERLGAALGLSWPALIRLIFSVGRDGGSTVSGVFDLVAA